MKTRRLIACHAAIAAAAGLCLSLSLRPGARAEDFAFAFEGNESVRKRLAELQGAAAPDLELEGWQNSEPLDLSMLRGRVVVLKFWATWCGPCIAGIPKTNELAERYRGRAEIIGICHPDGSSKMREVVEREGIRYPVAIDARGATIKRYKVNGYPDYYLIDAEGRVAVADCANGEVERVVERLLTRPPTSAIVSQTGAESPSGFAPTPPSSSTADREATNEELLEAVPKVVPTLSPEDAGAGVRAP